MLRSKNIVIVQEEEQVITLECNEWLSNNITNTCACIIK